MTVVVSDTRTAETDRTGPLLGELIERAGHRRLAHRIVPNDPAAVERALEEALRAPSDAVVFSGGTGMSRRDQTVDVVSRRFDRRLDGFGELFRWLSYQEIGTAALLSRATAGWADGRLVACLPGSTGAVRLAMEKLLLPELLHLVWDARR